MKMNMGVDVSREDNLKDGLTGIVGIYMSNYQRLQDELIDLLTKMGKKNVINDIRAFGNPRFVYMHKDMISTYASIFALLGINVCCWNEPPLDLDKYGFYFTWNEFSSEDFRK